jgi:N-acetylglutamate synthase-like GNAT family acetyltransferase
MHPAPKAVQPDGLRISTDPSDVDVDWLHAALSERSYWAQGRSRAVVEASLRGSLCFSALADGRQVGVARVVTDQATFAWVCDVFVDEAWRASGVGGRLMAAIVADSRLRGLRRMVLATATAATFYERFGFGPLDHPERWMERG